MNILKTVKKIPGGLMVVPLLLGAIINTFFGGTIWTMFDGTFTTYLWKSGAMPILAVFIFCNATTINFKKAGVTVYKGVVITAVKVGVGIIIGLICGKLFGEAGFLGLSTLNDGPFFTMVALGAAGVAKIPMSVLVGCIIPVIVGCIMGNLDEDIRKFCEPGASMLIPFFAFPLGAGLNIMNLIKAGGPGILLGVGCTLITGLAGYLVYKLLRMDHPEVGGAIGTTAGNAAATPASVAAVDATLLAVSEAATAQITAAIIVTAICCPILVSWLHKLEDKRRAAK